MSEPLQAVTRATKRRDRAYLAYLTAIKDAHKAGHTLREIGHAAGITGEGARYLINGDPRKRDDDR